MEAIPEQHRLMIRTAIATGLGWGELVALRPRHLDFEHARLTLEETIVVVPLRARPTGSGATSSATPRTTNPGTMGLPRTASAAGPVH